MAVIAESWKDDGRLAKPGVVATVMSNLGLERYLGSARARRWCARRSATATCSSTCAQHGYNVGGEQSGHIILSDYTTTGDGLVAALQVLAVVKKQRQAGVASLPPLRAAAAGAARTCATRTASRWRTPRCARPSPSAEQKLDGSGRLIVRPSGTEPVIRVMGEGDDKGLVEEVVDDIVEALTRDVAAGVPSRRWALADRPAGNPNRSSFRFRLTYKNGRFSFACDQRPCIDSRSNRSGLGRRLCHDRLFLQRPERPRCAHCRAHGAAPRIDRPGLWLPRLQRPMRPLRPHHPQDHGRGA